MSKLYVLIKKDITYFLRSKRFIVLLIVFSAFGMLSPVLAKYTPELLKSLGSEYSAIVDAMPAPSAIDGFVQLIKNFSQIGVFILIIMLSPIIISEKERGLLFKLKLHNINPRLVLLSQLVSQVILIGTIYIIASILFLFYMNILFPVRANHEILSLLVIGIYILYYVVVINLISYCSISKTAAIIFSFMFYFVMSIISMVKDVAFATPNGLITVASQILIGNMENSIKTILLNVIAIILLIVIVLTKKMFVNNKK